MNNTTNNKRTIIWTSINPGAPCFKAMLKKEMPDIGEDDINAIDGFLEKRAQGCEIVYGVRSSRDKDTQFKRGTARGYYKLLSKMGVEITYDHADYRLMSKKAVLALAQFKEVNLFLRGLVPMVGFKSDTVKYVRNERQAGESKYPLKKIAHLFRETYKEIL